MCFHDIFHIFYLISILVFQRDLVKKQSHKNSCSAHLEKFLPLFVLLALESFANILLCPELRPIESWKNSSKVVLFWRTNARTIDAWCLNPIFFMAKIYTPNLNIYIYSFKISDKLSFFFVQKDRFMEIQGLGRHSDKLRTNNATKIPQILQNIVRSICRISQKIWDMLEKTLLVVHSPCTNV